MLCKETHRQHLYNCIKAVFSHPIAKHLAFKGGTACYFFYGLPRFSTDIDIDLISGSGENYDEIVTRILQDFGKVKQGHHLSLSYGETDTNIHIDLNRRIWKSNRYEIKSFFGTDIRVQTIDTIVANKLVAFTERKAHRDFFDVYDFLIKAYPINEDVIHERTGKGLQNIYTEILHCIDAFGTGHNMLQGLGETLYDEKQKSWVKTKLLAELRGVVEMRLMK